MMTLLSNRSLCAAFSVASALGLGGCAQMNDAAPVQYVPVCDAACLEGQHINTMLKSSDPLMRGVGVHTLIETNPTVRKAVTQSLQGVTFEIIGTDPKDPKRILFAPVAATPASAPAAASAPAPQK